MHRIFNSNDIQCLPSSIILMYEQTNAYIKHITSRNVCYTTPSGNWNTQSIKKTKAPTDSESLDKDQFY